VITESDSSWSPNPIHRDHSFQRLWSPVPADRDHRIRFIV